MTKLQYHTFAAEAALKLARAATSNEEAVQQLNLHTLHARIARNLTQRG